MDTLGDLLYVGQDEVIIYTMNSNKWMRRKLNECFDIEAITHGDISRVKSIKHLYSAGVIGGSRHVMLQFLEKVTEVLDSVPHDKNCNMAAVNFVVHKYFDNRVYTGFPLTSRYKKYQAAPLGTYIIHK